MRQDQFDYTISVDGENIGTWDTGKGGHGDSEETKHRPGGMGAEKSYGGRGTRDNLTVERVYDRDRGDPALARKLDAKRGKAAVIASRQPLDNEGHAFGSPDVLTGILKKVTFPDHDSESSAIAMWSLEISVHGEIG